MFALSVWELAREARGRGRREGFELWRREALKELDLVLKAAPQRDDVMARRRVIEQAVFERPAERR